MLTKGLVKATVGGIAATLAMDALWYRRHRAGGGGETFADWELSRSTRSFADAAAPGKVGQILARRAGLDLPDSSAAMVNNVVHFATGIQWAVAHSLLRTVTPVRALPAGLATGVAAWATSYAVLPRLGVYDPIGEYDATTLANDLGAHLVFGATLGLVGWIVRAGR